MTCAVIVDIFSGRVSLMGQGLFSNFLDVIKTAHRSIRLATTMRMQRSRHPTSDEPLAHTHAVSNVFFCDLALYVDMEMGVLPTR